jgi:hypothetical protein
VPLLGGATGIPKKDTSRTARSTFPQTEGTKREGSSETTHLLASVTRCCRASCLTCPSLLRCRCVRACGGCCCGSR